MAGNSEAGSLKKPIAIYYEQQSWFVPLFNQLDARGANWLRVDARNHQYDPGAPSEYSLLFNRMSPSAWQRGNGHGIFYTLNYLKHLEEKGVRVVNGSRAFAHEISKAIQLTNLDSLGFDYPKARVINQLSQVMEAAEAIGPGDICQSTAGEELERRPGCPVDAVKNGLAVEAYEPPREVVSAVESIMHLAGVEVGGVEYVIDDATGRLLYYDANALSNFVADPERIIGFNPYGRLADFLIAEAHANEQKSVPSRLAGAAR